MFLICVQVQKLSCDKKNSESVSPSPNYTSGCKAHCSSSLTWIPNTSRPNTRTKPLKTSLCQNQRFKDSRHTKKTNYLIAVFSSSLYATAECGAPTASTLRAEHQSKPKSVCISWEAGSAPLINSEACRNPALQALSLFWGEKWQSQ